MKVLITGGTGFLGKHVQYAFDPYEEVHNIEYPKGYDLTKWDITKQLFETAKPDVVVHMAAVCGGIQANKNRPADFLRDNTQMGLNIYEAARIFGVKRVYSLGTTCVYPKYCPIPFKEDDIWNGPPEKTNFPYSQSKRTLLMLGQTYRDQYGIGGAHLIPTNLYGTFDHFDLVNSHVIPALINKFVTATNTAMRTRVFLEEHIYVPTDKYVKAVESNSSVVSCWGTGTATREFLYAADAAQAIVKAVVSDLDTDLPINLGSGKEISIKDLAYLIAKLTGFTGGIEFTGEVSDGQPRRCLDTSRARELLNWEASTSLVDGLNMTIDWYKLSGTGG